MSADAKQTIADFEEAVNMTAGQLSKWLKTTESQEVGFKKEDAQESVGHHMGEVIIDLLGKKKSDYSAEDTKHMAKVVGYVHRHLKQRPDGDIKETRWRYSLMNWGHDPVKETH